MDSLILLAKLQIQFIALTNPRTTQSLDVQALRHVSANDLLLYRINRKLWQNAEAD